MNSPMYPYLFPDNVDDEQPSLRRCLIVKYICSFQKNR